MNAILDYKTYTTEMNKGIDDKLFFMNLLKLDSLLDYGCADGNLIEHMQYNFPDVKYVGYDFNEKMINMAKNKKIPNSFFSYDLKEAKSHLVEKSGILCSSLIHEVYSYGTPEQIEDFWKEIYSGDYNYVIIRDMALSQESLDNNPLSLFSDITKVRNKASKKHLEQFESVWGSIDDRKNLIHFLLKYRYVNNWSREVFENYLPCSIEEHFSKIPDFYEIVHFEHFVLPFQKDVIMNDFGISLEEPTHIKVILKKK